MISVLIVDDDEKVARMLDRRLKKNGYEVYIAENGKIGVEKILELQPDLTLLDIYMPVMNGYDVVRNVREQGYQGLIVALTASEMDYGAPKRIKALQAGCDYFLTKPIFPDFEEQIKELIQTFRGNN